MMMNPMGTLAFNELIEINDIQNLSNNVLGHNILPSYLLSEEKYLKLVIGMEKDNIDIGLVYGVIEQRSNVLFLHFLFVKKEYRSYLSVLSLLKSTFKMAIVSKGVKHAIWKYTLDHNGSDLRVKLLRDIPFCRFRKIQSSRQFKIKTVDIDFIRKFKIYNPLLWRSKGYKVLTWSNCGEELLRKMGMLEQSSKLSSDYISPFSGNEDGQEYDKCYSYVLIKSETNEPMGWIMCSVVSKDEVMIRNFYMYPKMRSVMIAHSFATYILDVIAQRYKYLSFNVACGNRQMEMIVKKYFKPILKNSHVQCNAFVDFLLEGCELEVSDDAMVKI